MTKPTDRERELLVDVDELSVAGVIAKYHELRPLVVLPAVVGAIAGAGLGFWLRGQQYFEGELAIWGVAAAVCLPMAALGSVLHRRALNRYAAQMDLESATVDAILSAARRHGTGRDRRIPQAADVAHVIKAEVEDP